MSSCLVLQQYNKIFIGADTAISGEIENKIKRISNEGEKIFKKDNYIIFCSGDMYIANKMIRYIKTMNIVDLNKIQSYIRNIYNKNTMFEIFIADCNKEYIITYSLSSYRNFDFLITKCKEEETQIYALGFKTEETVESAYNHIKTFKGNVEKIYKNTFDDNCCEEIGGELNLYYSIKGDIKSKKLQLNDKYTPMIDCVLNKNDCNFLTADYLCGRIILGENLALDSDNGCFYIGDGDNVNDEDKGDFGLYVFDKVGTEKVKRIFLGIQQQANGDYQARLELYSKEGNKVVLSDEGILQTVQSSSYGYLSKSIPYIDYWYLDEGVNYVESCKLRFRTGALRATVKGTQGGGVVSTKTSSGGGGGTSQQNATQTSSASGGFTVNKNYTSSFVAVGKQMNTSPAYGTSGSHTHSIDLSKLTHSHNLNINFAIGNHQHTVPPHSHTISNHTHDISLDWRHVHELVFGLYESNTIAENISVYINDTLVASNLYGDNELEIGKYLKKGWNEIKFTSSNDGSIAFNIAQKSFNLF